MTTATYDQVKAHAELLAAHDDEVTFAAFGYRVLLDAFAYASAVQWRRRAEQLETAARPRPNDYPGRATTAEQVERYRRLMAAAQACRARADFLAATEYDFAGALQDLGAGI